MDSTTKKIPIDIIDDPNIAMRTSVDDDNIEELMADMRAVGLIEPIVVRPKGERYEIIAGHRRTRAARLLGWAHIESKIVNASDDKAFTMRAMENLSRHDVNPVDEACYIGELMKNANKTAEDISKLLHRSLTWVDQRLEVFEMPTYLQSLIKQKRVTLGAALELNKIQNEMTRKHFVSFAALNGCSIPQAKRWTLTANSEANNPNINVEQIATAPNETPQSVIMVRCARCAQMLPLPEADSVWVHPGAECPPDKQ